MKRAVWAALLVLVVAVALRTAGGAGFWRRYATALAGGDAQAAARLVVPRMRLPGVAALLPRATPEAESIAAEALQAAADAARRQGGQALLVHRHGHRVFEYFAAGRDGSVEVEGGELSPALMALSLGALVDAHRLEPAAAIAGIREARRSGEGWHNPWSAAAQRRFALAPPPAILLQDLDGSIANTISGRVWLPLGAADAALWGKDDSLLRLDCCVAARLEDWMRLADLLLQQGSYQGQRIVSPDWIRALLVADASGQRHPAWLAAQQPWTGDEPPAARDVYWFDLGSSIRVWLAPRRGLSVLYWGRSGDARDTLLPNIILRGLADQAPAADGMGELNDLVPGH